VARAETVPLAPYSPPARWDRGQVVVDSADLHLPSTLPPGPYRVSLSWRDPADRPVPLADGTERFEIGAVSLP